MRFITLAVILAFITASTFAASPDKPNELIESHGSEISFSYKNKEHLLFVGDRVYRKGGSCVLEISSLKAMVCEKSLKISPVYVVDTMDIKCPKPAPSNELPVGN